MNRQSWHRITSEALKLRNLRLSQALEMEKIPYLFTDRQREAMARANEEYEATILVAWEQYRQTLGPNHVVPNEVLRLQEQREKRRTRADT